MACMHIPVANFYHVLKKYGFGEGNLDVNLADNATAKANGDFGHVKAEENSLNLVSDKYRAYNIGEIFGRIGVKNALAGHCHFTNTSAVADNGVRYTFGLKAGLIPEATAGETGGTTFTFGENGFTAAPYYDNYANNTLTGVAETTNIIAYGETENGYRVAYGNKDDWAFIRFKTAYTLKAGANYTLSVKLRVNTLNNTALTNLNIDDNYNNEKFLNNWTEIGETNGKKEYTIKRNFQATADGDFLLRLACNYHGEYSFDVELFDVALAQPPFASVKDNTLVGKITDDGAQYFMANEGGWATCTATTRFSLTEGKRYTVSFLVSEISDASKIGNIYFDSTLGKISLTCITTGTKNKNGGYVCSVTFTAESSGVLDWRFAVNTKAAGLTFTISDFTVTEAAEA